MKIHFSSCVWAMKSAAWYWLTSLPLNYFPMMIKWSHVITKSPEQHTQTPKSAWNDDLYWDAMEIWFHTFEIILCTVQIHNTHRLFHSSNAKITFGLDICLFWWPWFHLHCKSECFSTTIQAGFLFSYVPKWTRARNSQNSYALWFQFLLCWIVWLHFSTKTRVLV